MASASPRISSATPGVAPPQSANPYEIDENDLALSFQLRNVGTKATSIPCDLSVLSTDCHHDAELSPASNGDTTRRPSASLYAEGLRATAAMILTTASASDPRAVMSGMIMILK